MVTLGFWDEFVGRPFVRASTMFHELGHTLALFHGGPETELTGESATWQPGAVSWGSAGPPRFRGQLQAELPELDELSVPGSRAVRRQRRHPPRLLMDSAEPLNEAGLLDAHLLPLSSAFRSRTTSRPGLRLRQRARAGASAFQKRSATALVRVRGDPQMARVHAEFSPTPSTGTATVLDASNRSNRTSTSITMAARTLGGLSDWDNLRLNQTGAVVTGISGGSAEGVFFDNSGTTGGGVFFHTSVFFDQSGVWFDQSGVWFDNFGRRVLRAIR